MLEKVTKQRNRKNPNHDDSLATALLLHHHLKIFIYIFIYFRKTNFYFIQWANFLLFAVKCISYNNYKISDMLPLQAQSNADSFIEAGRRHKTTKL